MPANTKYLTNSGWQRFLKLSAAVLGGYFVTISFHLALSAWLDKVTVIISSTYTGFILWVALMVTAFLSRSGWKIWGRYLLLTAVFTLCFFAGECCNP